MTTTTPATCPDGHEFAGYDASGYAICTAGHVIAGSGRLSLNGQVVTIEEPEGAAGDQEVPKQERGSQATRLVELAKAGSVEFFHSPDGDPFASITVNGHRETHALRARGFRRWLGYQFFEAMGKASGSQALQEAIGVLEGLAVYKGEEQAAHVRIARYDGAIYLDLVNDEWQAVKVTATGWQVVDNPPVRFRRTKGMAQLPQPVAGGTVDALKTFMNVASDDDFRLFCSWLVAALRDEGPYPVLVLQGEQGSAKSTAGRILKALIDPSTAPLRTAPREERDLAISATNAWLLAFDNLSRVPDWLSDALCRLATGGGFGTRQLYSDDDEMIFSMLRPAILTGIDDIVTRSDLLDRALIIELPRIEDVKRREEREFWRDFDAARPRLLGALLTAVSRALGEVDRVQLPAKPRMADFAAWSVAAAPALGWNGDRFLAAYQEKRSAVHELALESSPVISVLRTVVADKPWQGTAGELLTRLEGSQPDSLRRQHGWPKNGRALSGILNRLAPNLRAIGISVEFQREPRRRLISIQNNSAEDRHQRHLRHAEPEVDDANTPGDDATDPWDDLFASSADGLPEPADDATDADDANLPPYSYGGDACPDCGGPGSARADGRCYVCVEAGGDA